MMPVTQRNTMDEAEAGVSDVCDKPREQLTLADLRRWMFDHYQEHLEDGAVNVNTLEAALAVYFKGKPNPGLHEFVINFFLDLNEAAS